MDTVGRSTRSENAIRLQHQFSTIDIDVTLQILDLVQVKDILSVRQCSKHFNAVSRLRTVWHNALVRHVLEQDIPIPRTLDPLMHHDHRSVDNKFLDLSAEALETIVHVALRSSANWRKPVPKRSLTSYTQSKLRRVSHLKFIDLKTPFDRSRRDHLPDIAEDTEGRYILTAGYRRDGVFRLDVWDLESSHGDSRIRRVGGWTEFGMLFRLATEHVCGPSTLAPDGQDHQMGQGALIAFCIRTSSSLGHAYTLRILRFSPSSHSDNTSSGGVTLIKSIPVATPAWVESLCDRRLAIRMDVDRNNEVLKVIDWSACPSITGASEDHSTTVELTASQYGMDRTVLKVHFIHDWVLVFRDIVVEFYFLPPWLIAARASAARPNSLQPVCLHKWAWNLKSLSVSHRVSWIHDRRASTCLSCANRGSVPLRAGNSIRDYPLVCVCRYRPLSIAIRFDSHSHFPSPVNLMHHYVLPTQIFYNPVSLARQSLAEGSAARASADASESSPTFDAKYGLPPTHNSPYLLPPLHEHTIPSDVRLSVKSDLDMCRYGSLIWLDSEADYSPGPLSNISLRLVDDSERPGEQSASPSQSPPHANEEEEVENDEHDNGYPGGPVYADDGTGERIAGRHLDMESAVSRASESTVEQGYGSARTVTTLFGARQWEGWYSIAANERAGRVVVGDKEGGIEVWDYF